MVNKIKTKELVIVSAAVVVVILIGSSTAYGNTFSFGMFPNMGLMPNTQSSNSYAGMMGGMGNMMAGMGGMMNGYQMSGDSEQGFEMPCLNDAEHIDGQMVFGDYQVIIGNYDFHPQNLTVKIGTTVTWINMDLVGHNVEAGTHEEQEHLDELFESPMLEHMQSFSYTFSELGEYVYHCDPHPYMEGKIIVVE